MRVTDVVVALDAGSRAGYKDVVGQSWVVLVHEAGAGKMATCMSTEDRATVVLE